jgi:hypothetical protein
MAGRPGPNRSGGSNKIPAELHVLRGTYRPGRHQAELDAGQPVWQPSESQVHALATEGRALIDRLRAVYTLNPWEGELALEAAVIADRLAEIRTARLEVHDLKMRLTLDKTEQLWSKQLAALLLALRVRT